MKKIIALSLSLVCCVQAFDAKQIVADTMSDVQARPQHAMMIVALTLLARPAYYLVQQYLENPDQASYGLGSLIGGKFGLKEATDKKAKRLRAQISLGSADVKVKLPTDMNFVKKSVKIVKKAFTWKDKKKPIVRRVVDPVMQSVHGLVDAFAPYLHIGIEDKETPIVRDKTVAHDPSTDFTNRAKRLYLEAACGTLCARTGMDLEDALLVPLALISTYLASMYHAHQAQGN